MKIGRIFVGEVDVGNRLRPINERTVVALAESMQRLGQLSPISVYRMDDNSLRLVTGLHRLEAAKSMGWQEIEAVFSTGNEIERELEEIAENLHRSELTALERDTQIGRWAELTAAKVGQIGPPSGGAQPAEKGVRKVARELKLDRKDVERAVKVASLSSEAMQAARVAGLDDNRTALLDVAKEATPDAQVAKICAISSAKSRAKAKNKTVATVAFEPNELKKSGDIADIHLAGAVNRFVEFCRANSPASVAAGILPGKFAEVRGCISDISDWLGRFVTAMGCVEADGSAAKVTESPRGPDIVPPARCKPVAATSDLWRDLDFPAFLDRRRKAPAKENDNADQIEVTA
jgi:ParB-like chromosome segregation protein Spo0J